MVRTETRNLPVRLTDEEWSAAATQLADLGGQIEKLKDEKKRAAQEIQGQITSLENLESEYREIIRSHQVNRPIVCIWYPDTARQIAILRREDNNDYVTERSLTQEELQIDMFSDEPTIPPPPRKRRRKEETIDEEIAISEDN